VVGHFLNFLKENEIVGICVVHEEKIHVYKILVGKPEGKRSHGKPNSMEHSTF
jgi:hypothetical protein